MPPTSPCGTDINGSADLSRSGVLLPWGSLLAVSLVVCALLGNAWEARLASEVPVMALRGAGPRSALAATPARPRGGGNQVYQKIRETGSSITAEYGFVNFNDDPLVVSYAIPARELAAYKQDYGYTAAERGAIDQWLKNATEDAYQHAVKTRQSQEQLNRAGERVNAEYRARLADFFRSRGFAVVEGNMLVADIPEIVRRNVKKVRNVALAINGAGEKLGYDSDSIITAALSFVQTAVRYDAVPMEVRGRQTGGIYPPLETLTLGKGDCDTKAALLGAILLNWDRVKAIGMGVPNHYLMGVLRNPAKGDVFVEFKGLRYVLVEPSGPGWLPPGTVSRETIALLSAKRNLKIEAF